MIEQPGDEKIVPFSFMSGDITRDQVSCWLTYTSEETHNIIRDNISPEVHLLFSYSFIYFSNFSTQI